MLERKDIKDGTLVCDEDRNLYGIIDDVGNAREKGDRGESTTPDDELSYTVVDILTTERNEGICEHSAMTSDYLSVITKKDVEIYLDMLEADAMLRLAQVKKEIANINDAINRFSKIK